MSTGKVLANFFVPGQIVTCVEYNPQNLALASGSSSRIVSYWDLEQFSLIHATQADSSPISHLAFDENAEFLFAGSNDNIKLWNIENNKLLDCLSIIPKTISDLKIASYERFLQLSAISNSAISVWYAPLESLNFDESMDFVPSSEGVTTSNKSNN